jgi:hypothetical protein
LLLQGGFELLVELGLHSLADTLQRPKNLVLSTIGFILCGAIAGGVSLLFFPKSPIANPVFRKVNLVVTPLLLGAIMASVGRAREKRGQTLVRLDRIGYAFTFAFFHGRSEIPVGAITAAIGPSSIESIQLKYGKPAPFEACPR